jgi:Kae1-associated kinase Bud32
MNTKEKQKTKTGEKTIPAHLEGAEAVLTPLSMAGVAVLSKERQSKPYRPKTLDEKIRSSRTRVEARLLAKAKAAGVPAPTVLAVGPYDIRISRLEGKTLNKYVAARIPLAIWKLAGRYLARLHKAGIVHGDYTPANLMLDAKTNSLFVIDFGLGCISRDTEDFAVDVLTMKKALKEKKPQAAFLDGYKSEGEARVLKVMAEVEKRARYVDRGAG